jgi:hypothetical protein
VARRPEADKRQADFFATPAPASATADPHPARRGQPKQHAKKPSPPPTGCDPHAPDTLDILAARLSPAELSELVAILPDHALAHLVIVTVRQLKRRLARSNRHADRHRTSSPLERAARQLIAELGEQGADDDI